MACFTHAPSEGGGEGGFVLSLRTLRSCGVLVDWGSSLVEWSFTVTRYNPVDGLATRSYVQMVSSWCYHCFRKVGGGKIRRLPYAQAIKLPIGTRLFE